MSNEHLKTDEEKAEELKAWWKDNGNSVIAGVALTIALLFGYDYWKNYQQETSEKASEIYSEIQKDSSGVVPEDKLKLLQENYARTTYAAFASLDDARGYAEAGDYERASTSLQWVLDNASDAAIKDVTRLRLARVKLAQGQLDQAMALASIDYPKPYQALVDELKGDIYVAKNELGNARTAYDKAIAANQSGSANLIQLKRDNLGEGA